MDPSLSELLADAARRFSTSPAVLHEGGEITYSELLRGAELLAGRLHQLSAGKRIGLLLPNLPTFPLALHGVLRAGSSAVMLNPANSPREVEEHLRASGTRLVLTTADLRVLLPTGIRALLVDALPDAVTLVEGSEETRYPLEGAPPPPPLPSGDTDEAALLFTAAEGGWARGAPLTHRNLVANLRSTAEAMRLTGSDRVVAALPLVHAFGLTMCVNAPLAVGAAMIPVERFNPLRVLDLLSETRATVFGGVPAMYLALLSAVQKRGASEHSLRVAICGGAPVNASVQQQWEALFGIPLRQGYGLTEASPVCLFNLVDRPNRPGTLGFPLPRVEVAILGPSGAEVPDGEVGEICVRGDNVFSGYLEADEDGGPFHGDWLRTGDLGSREPDGAVRFRGLLKHMFTRNGFNVYPREVERVLREDPRIEEAHVGAQPDPLRENEVILKVRAAPGATLTEEEVREVCRARLAAYKHPARIEILS